MATTEDPNFKDVEAGTEAPLGVDLPPEVEEARILKPIPDTTPMERVAGAIAAAAVITSIAAIIVEQTLLVIIAGILSSFVGPYCYFQQTQLTEIKALKETQRAVQEEVNRLKNENNRLEANIGKMGESVEHLQDVKTALDTITATQTSNIAEFKDQVEKNRTNLKMMQANTRNAVAQSLISIMERMDSDRDSEVEPHEVEEALDAVKKLPGVKVNESKFRKAFSGLPADSLLRVIRQVNRDDIPQEERIFEISDGSEESSEA